MRWIVSCGLVLCFLGPGLSQAGKPRPEFSDYSVQKIYKGKPATPVLSKDQRWYRTAIREGAKRNMEFAGHYTVPSFGCGTGCSAFYIVDSISGKVYDGFAASDLPDAWLGKHDPEAKRMEFHPNSRLFKINGCPNETDCGFYDYVMVSGVGLKLVRKELLPKEFQ